MLQLAIQCLCDDRWHHHPDDWVPILLWLAGTCAAFGLALLVSWFLQPTRRQRGWLDWIDDDRLEPTFVRRCACCRQPLSAVRLAPAVRCPGCDVQHHADCWREHGGCTVLGCRRAASARRLADPS